MSLRPLRRPLAAAFALLLLPAALPSAGCQRDDDQKLAVVQALARDLSTPKQLKQRAGCSHLVAEQRELFLCDGLVQTLLHFAPAFPGSTVTALGASSGGWRGKPARLGVHYQGAGGAGNLEVMMRREGTAWRIMALVPRQ